MTIRSDDIGDRLKAFRLASGLSADEIANRIGISRTALYRFEKGEVAKIDTLEKLADLLDVSVPTLLGVGVEYIPSALAFFERLRQIEETTEHIVVLAGPVSFLLASDVFDQTLEECLSESIPAEEVDRDRAVEQVHELLPILRQRKETYRSRQPGILNLISGAEIERFLQNGLIGRLDLPEDVLKERRVRAGAEAEHLIAMMEEEPIAVQIGIVPGTLPHTSFQIFRQADRKVLAMSPFRLGEQPNVHGGIAMITSAPEALGLHERTVEDLWRRALRGAEAAAFLRQLIARQPS
ncbi:MAG: transcriptional regulator [Rhodospirillaceae bacterium]|nr:transcriptional regulator [Rhodospirillaceae bacterium]|tara:strand:+ start:18790 stop:19674 length:885 start_codon:yes stop_codon:yes gene_type:complete